MRLHAETAAHSRSAYALLLSAIALSCSHGPSPELEIVRAFGSQVSVVAVAPINLTVELPNELEGTAELVSDALDRQLDLNGKTIRHLDFGEARAAWSAAINEIVASGGEQSFQSAARAFVRKIRETIEFDAFILPSVFIQKAEAASRHSHTRSWDGATQAIKVLGSPEGSVCAGTLVEASSVLVAIFDREGNEIQSKQSGIELLYTFEAGPHPERNTISCHYAQVDPTIGAARAGVARGLSPFIPILPPTPKTDGQREPESTP